MNPMHILVPNESSSVITYNDNLSPVSSHIPSALLREFPRTPMHANLPRAEFLTLTDIPILHKTIVHKTLMRGVCNELRTVFSEKDGTEIMEECMECFHTIPSSKAIYNTVFYERYAYCNEYCRYDHERELRKEYRRQHARNRTQSK